MICFILNRICAFNQITNNKYTCNIIWFLVLVDDVNAVTAFHVVDEICNDVAYENEQEKEIDDDINLETVTELLEATVKGGKVEPKGGEVILEVRPQYSKFSARELADRLKQMGLELVCLPWIANTGRHYYTAGFKITEKSYDNFKTRGDQGAMPKGFYRVDTSWKYN